MNIQRFIVHGDPVAKPRQTRADKWKKRPCVMKYRAWADSARAQAGQVIGDVIGLSIISYIQMPSSWNRAKMNKMHRQLHRQKPDGDNILKSVADALFKHDQAISIHKSVKYWTIDNPRCEIEVWTYEQ